VPKVLQAKTAAPQTRPSALPARSAQPAPGIVQPKKAVAQPPSVEGRPGRSAPEPPSPMSAFGRIVTPPRAEQAGINPPQIRPHVLAAPTAASRNTVQRAGDGGGAPPPWEAFNRDKSLAAKMKKEAAKVKPAEEKKDEEVKVGAGAGGVTRLTLTDAAELAPGITSTDGGKAIGPFSGDKVDCGKVGGFADAKGVYAIAPDLDSHSGAFTWKLFKWSGKKRAYVRIDTLDADGSRQNRG
jgi:hypothetical protein